MRNRFHLGIAYKEPGMKFPILFSHSICANSFEDAKDEFTKISFVAKYGIGEIFVHRLGGLITKEKE